eukprot:5413585-Lingulodinium_polyedra.AAC.1
MGVELLFTLRAYGEADPIAVQAALYHLIHAQVQATAAPVHIQGATGEEPGIVIRVGRAARGHTSALLESRTPVVIFGRPFELL